MDKFRHLFGITFFTFALVPHFNDANLCGCKSMRPCYVEMLNTLRDKDEEACIENVAVGVSTIMIYLKALKEFCPDIITVNEKHVTFEGRHLYEVVAHEKQKTDGDEELPVIIIDAGQYGGNEAPGMVLVFLQQLAACEEYTEMLQKVKWVILPSVNPDGMEYSRYNKVQWNKNLKPSEDKMSFGVDISRNFDSDWSSCDKIKNGWSDSYPGPGPFSENETIFIRDVLIKYKSEAKAYLSVRRNGHSILRPYANRETKLDDEPLLRKISTEIVNRVNQRAGVIQLFVNDSIFGMNGQKRCGHSVDYAYDLGIHYSFEMRVFLSTETEIMSRFQTLPRGYYNSLLLGYLSGLKKMYDLIVNEVKKNTVHRY